ncbi:hypothetical protein BDN71DRAFT_1506182 [Pleurotus eryngii]|uniref:Uncharacterized protein n=1 Tax=Pleurotus eryngii TaxID=5323 RepID=A0A9P5ZYY4_PLEER|nr:hypothetical protein BDN71DRAFT_1506182 [Pleurotus eryngii]
MATVSSVLEILSLMAGRYHIGRSEDGLLDTTCRSSLSEQNAATSVIEPPNTSATASPFVPSPFDQITLSLRKHIDGFSSGYESNNVPRIANLSTAGHHARLMAKLTRRHGAGTDAQPRAMDIAAAAKGGTLGEVLLC